jgi:diguanylate cyclase (GGDEF)-like protein/PAS domain S-box-containing protein
VTGLPTEAIHALLNQLGDGVYFVDRDRRITFWNQAAQRITGFAPDEVVGHLCQSNLLRHVDSAGRCLCTGQCPLAATMRDGQERRVQLFLHHQQGHRVPIEVRTMPVRDEQGQIIGAVESFSDRRVQQLDLERVTDLERAAYIDALTGIANRRYFQLVLEGRLADRRRLHRPFGLLLGDIDHFKLVNDTHGHLIGDRVLEMVAQCLAANARTGDLVARWGGEEFAIIVDDVAREGLCNIAERYRCLVAAAGLRDAHPPVAVTISFGCAVVEDTDASASLITRADQMLYQSKHAGRNRVSFAA